MQTNNEGLTKQFVIDLVSRPFLAPGESPAKYLPRTYRITDRQLQTIMEYKLSLRLQQMRDDNEYHLPG